MQKLKTVIVGLVIVGAIGLLFYGFSSQKQATENIQDSVSFNKEYSIKSVIIPDSVYFAGERVPIQDFDTYESLDREMLVNTYWQSQTLIFLKRAQRFFPVIEPILQEHGVPVDFKYLAVAESGLANVASPSNAKGFWQFLKGTAGDYNLEVNDEVDERYHLEKSTHAAAEYIKYSYNKFGSWAMAAAAYNAGNRNVSRYINAQKTYNYYDLVLGEETGRYVFRLIALKLIMESPEKYGFTVYNSEKYSPIPYSEVIVDSNIQSFPDFAHNLGTNYKMLKELNPWLRDNKLSNKYNKSYIIKIASPKARLVIPDTAFYKFEMK